MTQRSPDFQATKPQSFEVIAADGGSDTRRLITASNQYGLTKGSYLAEYWELTPLGAEASGDDVPVSKQIATRFELAINKIEQF